ncbi:MAG: N-6 DNA methylase [Verrucomicrobiales bacterium]|nr:N-6 DNA methylase [Verrucomicrobiales bacterium]
MPRRSSDSIIFDSLDLEGALFIPAVLEKAARGELPDQRTPADYRIPAGLSLLDEQGRAFRIASALFHTFDGNRSRSDVEASRVTEGFIKDLFRDAFGYSDFSVCQEPLAVGDRAFPVTALTCAGRVPVIVAPHALDLDTPHERFAILGSGARRRSAYQLAQQFLNASTDCTWAVVTNGRQLRLLRDADTLTRPAYLEADLELILREQRYADFAAVWRIFHASRAGQTNIEASWESWRKQGQDQGERVREGLREGVTQALLAFGSGFLAHPNNHDLRARLEAGDLSVDAYFQQLLRLIYRCLFVFTAEERGLLHVEDNNPAARVARETYAAGYAFRRLRDRALRRSGFDRHGDLWTGCRLVFHGLAAGEPRLALPALGGLFTSSQCPDLDRVQLENRALLDAMRHLRWSGQGGSLAAIDYRNMGPEELGSVYESLLELVPTVDLPARTFGFIGLTSEGLTGGNARKTSGSYYTPDSLVQELLDSALDPVIAQRIAARPDAPAEALLSISVIDPACGSGHFLLAAARRLAERLAELRAVEGAVTPADYRHALREVIARCIHGVDRNPMALELARTALWLEGYEPGQPLSFLDHHLVCGDALLGLVDFKTLTAGIPADAFKALTGDDKEVCKRLAAANRAALKTFERRRKDPDFFREADTANLLQELAALEAMPESTPAEVEAKAGRYTAFLQHARDSRLAQAADLLIAAFLTPKDSVAATELCPTTHTLADLLFPRQDAMLRQEVLDQAQQVCRKARVLHWPTAFAGVFAKGGFDCVLGNPPWERIKIQEQEYFASRHPLIAKAANASARQRLIANLADGSEADRRLLQEFKEAKRLVESASMFMHVSGEDGGRFPLSGVGDVNTYALFAEAMILMTEAHGYAGFLVPTGIATDDSTKTIFEFMTASRRLKSLYDFQSSPGLFCEIGHARFKFCLLTVGGRSNLHDRSQYSFFLRRIEALHQATTTFDLSADDIRLLNPNTRTCPVFRAHADAELTKKIYRRVPVLIREPTDDQPEQNPWGISFSAMFHMANDSGLFLTAPSLTSLPLYEAKMIHQFDHRWATYRWDAGEGEAVTEDVSDAQKARADSVVQPRYWVEERHVLSRLAAVPRCVTKAWDDQSEDAIRDAFAIWIASALSEDALAELRGQDASARQRVIDAGGHLFAALPAKESDWFSGKAAAEARDWQVLTADELACLRDAQNPLAAAHAILDRRSLRWLMGWRDICRSADERTVIASVVPRSGAGDTLLLMFPQQTERRLYACLLADQNSLVHDYIARQKLGGTHLKYHVKKQLVNIAPSGYGAADLAYIVPRVLELTYTAHDLKPWAEDLGYTGAPFVYDPARRAIVRAELDAWYARLYGLTRDELRYILDPSDTHGPDYPTETFRGLKTNEMRAHGEYRTRRLVLEAWDAQNRS